jgi:hypothetical protein
VTHLIWSHSPNGLSLVHHGATLPAADRRDARTGRGTRVLGLSIPAHITTVDDPSAQANPVESTVALKVDKVG